MPQIDINTHLEGFARSFLQYERRDRWAELLTKRPNRISSKSHKLHNALDRSRCKLIDDPISIQSTEMGVFYDFYSEPSVMFYSDALEAVAGSDAIFSFQAGKLALFFFHEDECWLCST